MLSSRAYAAFISYAHRYLPWVRALRTNLERCLAHAGRPGKVFLDEVDLGAGRSWVAQLQAGLDRAERLVLIATPEALASSRVAEETEAKIARDPDWRDGRLLVVNLVDAPLPPFLEPVQSVDFRDHDETKYRQALRQLVSALLGQSDRRGLPEQPAEIEIPDPPVSSLPSELRSKLVDWLSPVLESKNGNRRIVELAFGFQVTALERYPSWACAASAVVVKATGEDDALRAAVQIVESLHKELHEDLPERMPRLEALRGELAAVRGRAPESSALERWFRQMAADHAALTDGLDRPAEMRAIERAWVRLELARPEPVRGGEPRQEPASAGFERPEHAPLEDFLALDRAEHPWVTGCWLVEGDPGSGKTTLLRHLAARLAGEASAARVPLYLPLPKLTDPLRLPPEYVAEEYGALCGKDIPAVLDRAGIDGQLVVLLDGLDEVPPERRERVDRLLFHLEANWPASTFVLTSRPIGLGEPPRCYRKLFLQPLDRSQRRAFLEKWFHYRGEPDPAALAARAETHFDSERSLGELSHNPLHLTLLTLLWEKGIEAPRRRSQLYDEIFSLLLEGRHKKPPRPISDRADVQEALCHLAYGQTVDDRNAEEPQELERRLLVDELDAVRRRLEKTWGVGELRRFLIDVFEKTWILGPHDGPRAPWRFWHRTFREALAAKRLEALRAIEGEEALLGRVGAIRGDEGRWAEPFALLAGRLEKADPLVTRLAEVNRPLGLRALATTQGLSAATVRKILRLTTDWRERRRVFLELPEQLADPEARLVLIDELRRRTSDGNDLFFLHWAAANVIERSPAHAAPARRLLDRFYDHIPAPADPRLFCSVETLLDGGVPLWRSISPGRTVVGSPMDEGHPSERPRHRVELNRVFSLAAVPVTCAQYMAFDAERAAGGEPQQPIVNVSWYEAVSFCRWLASQVAGCRGARLPREEEWELACRAGNETAYWSGDRETDLARVGWYKGNSGNRLHAVGDRPANGWGLYDMHGNVWEWTASLWRPDGYSGRAKGSVFVVDPAQEPADLAGPIDAPRVMRGGSCWASADEARSAYRLGREPDSTVGLRGFRVILPGPWRPEP